MKLPSSSFNSYPSDQPASTDRSRKAHSTTLASRKVRSLHSSLFQRLVTTAISWMYYLRDAILPCETAKHLPSEANRSTAPSFGNIDYKKYSRKELAYGTQQAIEQLEREKQLLFSELGESAGSFISRHIDPILIRAKKMLSCLHKESKSPLSQKKTSANSKEIGRDAIDSMIESTELYALVLNKDHLIQRSIQHAELHAKQAILQDIEIVRSYRLAAMDELFVQSSTQVIKRMRALDQEIEMICQRLEQLSQAFPRAANLRELIAWRRICDEERQGLVAFATLVVDVYLLRHHCLSRYFEDRVYPEADQKQSESCVLVTEAHIADGASLMNCLIEIECLLQKFQTTLKEITQEHAFQDQIAEVAEQLSTALQSLKIPYQLNVHEINKMIERLDIVRAAASQRIYFEEPPVS